MRVHEQIGQLSALPSFARSSFAVLDKVNRYYIAKIFLSRRTQQSEWTIAVSAWMKRSVGKISKHANRSASEFSKERILLVLGSTDNRVASKLR